MNFREKVGFISGCFDSPQGPHNGHLYILEFAKSNCDYLIVGLNSDNYIKHIKGREPMLDELSRYFALLQTGFVDDVVIFDSLTPIDIIRYYKPSILFLGNEGIRPPWEREVLLYGAQIKTVNRISGISSTKIHESINSGQGRSS